LPRGRHVALRFTEIMKIAPGYAPLQARRSGERRIDRESGAQGVASLASGDYCLQSCASGSKRAAGLQWVFRLLLRAGSGAYPGCSAGAIAYAKDVFDSSAVYQ